MKASNIVVHFASETHVDRSILAAAEFIKTDVIGTFVPLEAARGADRLAYSYWAAYGVPVVITRASNNYGPNEWWWRPIKEEDPAFRAYYQTQYGSRP